MTEKEMCNLMIQDIDNWDKIIGPEISKEFEYGCYLKDYSNDYYPFNLKYLDKNFEYGIQPGDVIIQNAVESINNPFPKGQRWMVLMMPPLYYKERKRYPLGSEDLYTVAYSVFTIGARVPLGHVNKHGEIDMDYYDIVDMSKYRYIKAKRNKAEEIAYQNHIINKIPIKHIFAGW